MFYLPDEWFKDKKNENSIRKILKGVNTDLVMAGEKPISSAIKKLEELGETIIIEKIKDGTIMFGA